MAKNDKEISILQKPAIPVRTEIKEFVRLEDYDTQPIFAALEELEAKGIDPKTARVSFVYGYNDYKEAELIGFREETDNEFESRMVTYRKELKHWEKWYEDNHIMVETQTKKERLKRLKRLQAQRTELEKEIKELEG